MDLVYINVNPKRKKMKILKNKTSIDYLLFILFVASSTFMLSQEDAPAPTNDMNWISNINFDLNGNTLSKNVNYYNTLGNNTQNQFWDVLTNKIWNSETKYDRHGRSAFQTLNAPIGTTFSYKSNFIRQTNGSIYGVSQFDSNPENPVSVGNQLNSLGWYYSNNNTTEPYQDITSYPFSRTVFSKLNPGKTKKSLGGNKVNGQWLQTYSFTMPAPGQANGVNKIVTRDVHGVDAVVFTDAEGNTVKIARSGNEDGTKPIRTIYGLIKEQGFVDIHISVGCSGISITNPTSNGIRVYNLITEAQVSSSHWSSLPNGFYRVAVSNSDMYKYEPSKQIKVSHKINYYDFSNNYYDKANRLKSSSQPLSSTMSSRFTYNSLGQLLENSSPDEGTVKFKYRKDGQVRFSQNSKQSVEGQFSYTNYDNLGRPIETGIIESKSFTSANPDVISLPSGTKKEQQFTTYDIADSNFSNLISSYNLNPSYYKQQFLAGSVSKTWTENPKTNTSWYSYDAYGRVIWIVQNIEGLGIKTIDYEYDFATGKVTKVLYQKYVASERFIHKYTYNRAGQLTKVETSEDNRTFTTQADYIYYENGSLKRTNLADGIQGIDYVYNLNGQLKSINHPSLLSSKDPGGDSNDLFGMQLDYYSSDYARSQRGNISISTTGTNQYNGNIKGMRWNTSGSLPTPHQSMYNYSYNKNNWLKQAEYGQYLSGSTASNGTYSRNSNRDYEVSNITYDANGNIKTLKRNGYTGGGNNAMDDFTYHYKSGSNQLNIVTDENDNTNTSRYNDLKNQGDASLSNYIYNSIGQLEVDIQDGLSYQYNASGLVTQINRFSLEDTGEWFSLYNNDFNGLNLFSNNDLKLWEVNVTGLLKPQIASVINFHGLTKPGVTPIECTPLATAYGNALALTFPANQLTPITKTKRPFLVVKNAKHKLDMDLLVRHALQSNRFSSQDIPVGAKIRVLAEDGSVLASANYNTPNPQLLTNSDWDCPTIGIGGTKKTTLTEKDPILIDDNITIGDGKCKDASCDEFFDDEVHLTFTPTTSKIYLEVEVDVNYQYASGISYPRAAMVILDNIHLQVAKDDTPFVAFFYDDKGKRIRKDAYTETAGILLINKTYYIRDITGNPVAIYTDIDGPTTRIIPTLKEQPIYGNSRLGVHYRQGSSDAYQLTDHLGNVRAVIVKQGSNAAAITAKTDYYPFGEPMPNRHIQGDYRYAYQGQEKATEPEMEAFELRLWDGRIGRWLTTDPAGEFFSPYLGMGNRPTVGIDPDGGDVIILVDSKAVDFLGEGKELGHAAVLIGSKETGWRYVSMNGTGPDSAKPYGGAKDADLGDVKGQNLFEAGLTAEEVISKIQKSNDKAHHNYDKYIRITSTPTEDNIAYDAAKKQADRKTYGVCGPGASCIDPPQSALYALVKSRYVTEDLSSWKKKYRSFNLWDKSPSFGFQDLVPNSWFNKLPTYTTKMHNKLKVTIEVGPLIQLPSTDNDH